jgi:DNA-binding response OmpR family regulator
MQVLVADDDEAMRLWFEVLLEEAGHEVLLAEDGGAALARWREARPPLMLLDWQMPGLDGIAVCRALRGEDPEHETFVFMVTARDAGEDLSAVLDAGADDFVTKPLTPQVFQTRLQIAERRIELERQRREVQQALARARYLAGIGETAIAIQHEINNPLTALLGSAALLKQGLIPPEEAGETLDVIVEQAERIAEVVKRLRGLKEPRAVEYLGGQQMIDLSGAGGT